MKTIADTHAHLCDPAFEGEIRTVLERAWAAGISPVIAVGENLADAKKNLSLAAESSTIRPAAGLYPTYLDIGLAEEVKSFIKDHQDRLVAIGEVGLDYWMVKGDSEREIQREIFQTFINLANELGLPLNVHSRSAGRQVLEMLLKSNAKKVQLHAFDGRASTAMPAVEAGYFFSIPPSIVRSEQKQKLVKKLPLSCLLVESDSPVLGPVPRERNEPANTKASIIAIAEIKGVSLEETFEVIAENTHRLYGDAIS